MSVTYIPAGITVLGTDNAETLYGGSGDDTILGNAGNDVIRGYGLNASPAKRSRPSQTVPMSPRRDAVPPSPHWCL